MSFRDLPKGGGQEAMLAWMRDVVDAINALERQQPIYGPSIQIGDMRLDAVTVGTTVHLIATNTLTGARALIV